MIGDNIILKEEYLTLGKQVFQKIENAIKPRTTISVGGESGSGKSTLAFALKQVLEQKNYSVCILHMDDYFHQPPADTHNDRLADLKNVGLQEVNLSLLQNHIEQFKNDAISIEKPLVYFKENKISTEKITFCENTILIIEGTYVTQLSNIDTKVFMTKNFKDTYEARMKRGRDQGTDFVEKVLAFEHQLIAPDKEIADLLVNENYELVEI